LRKLKPVTPGELLLEEFLRPMGISRYRLAKEISVPATRIADIVTGKRAVTADTDLRLCRFFGLSNGYWLRAQAAYDTEVAEDTMRAKLARIRPWASNQPAVRDTSISRSAQPDRR
jgi:addiction module HigA family antidote